MRRNLYIGLLLMVSFFVNGQQDQMHTQFMFNKQSINPAYVANDGLMQFSFLVREQWISFPGAPSAQNLSFSSPFGMKRAGIGINLERQGLGITNRYTVDGMYAYRFNIGKGVLSTGLMASGRRYVLDFKDDRLSSQFPVDYDPSIDASVLSKQVFNAGFGLYFNTDQYYIGFSIPRLIQTDIEFDSGLIASQEFRHLYLMAGASIALDSDWNIVPQVLLKSVDQAPLDVDISALAQYQERIMFGLNYRFGGRDGSAGESIDLLAAFHATPSLLIGISYDISLSDINEYQDGSLELMLSYSFMGAKPSEKIINPRYF